MQTSNGIIFMLMEFNPVPTKYKFHAYEKKFCAYEILILCL